jgi:hypothetical protein
VAGLKYDQIWYFENKKRREELLDFRLLLVEYFTNLVPQWNGPPHEKVRAREARPKINKQLHAIRKYLEATDVSLQVVHQPPPVTGKSSVKIDVIYNLFQLYQFQIDEDYVFDILEQAYGQYENDKTSSKLRSLSPIFWMFKLASWITSIPFRLFGVTDYYHNKVEGSSIQKIISGIFTTVSFIAAIAAIFDSSSVHKLINNLLW